MIFCKIYFYFFNLNYLVHDYTIRYNEWISWKLKFTIYMKKTMIYIV